MFTEPHHLALREQRVFLIENMIVTDVLDYLIQDFSLTADDEESIADIAGPRAKMRRMLDILQTKEEKAFHAMIEGLKANHCDHVVKRLMESFRSFQGQSQSQSHSSGDIDPSQIRLSRDQVDAVPIKQGTLKIPEVYLDKKLRLK